LNLGCGHVQPAGWLNVDGSNRAWLATKLPRIDRALVQLGLLSPTEFNRSVVWVNLLKPFPWRSDSIAAIYMGEILEHFTKDQGATVLRECHRVLQPRGRLRIRVPDHAEFWRRYVRDYDAVKARPVWDLSHTRWTQMYFDTLSVSRPKPWHSIGHFHKWMYDEVSLILAMRDAGFAEPERRAFHDSAIPDIVGVEVRNDLIVEAEK
jgi:predicted SAM-dependent methyltransferase